MAKSMGTERGVKVGVITQHPYSYVCDVFQEDKTGDEEAIGVL